MQPDTSLPITNETHPEEKGRALLRVGDVIVGPAAFQELFDTLFKEIGRTDGDQKDPAYQEKKKTAWERLLSEVMRKVLSWQDDADRELTAQQIRARAVQDAADLDRICCTFPDAEGSRAASGWSEANKVLDRELSSIDHGPLAWGWAAACEGALPVDNGEASASLNSDFMERAIRDPDSPNSARVMDFVDTWPETIWAAWPFLGPQVGQESMDYQLEETRGVSYRIEDMGVLTAALVQGSWAAAEMIWRRQPALDAPAATQALRATLQYLFDSKEHSEHLRRADDPLAPLRWAQRLVRAGADTNALIEVRYVGSDTASYGNGARHGPVCMALNGRIADKAKEQENWRLSRTGWGADRYFLPNAATKSMGLTLSELVILTICSVGKMGNGTTGRDGEGQSHGKSPAERWATFWARQWRRTTPVLALPWHEHTSALDAVIHHALLSLRARQENGNAASAAVMTLVRSLAQDEAGAGKGWWTRPATAEHPWPAWEMAAQLSASTKVVAPSSLAPQLTQILLETLPEDVPLPGWVVQDSARAVVEEALRATTTKTKEDGSHYLSTVSPQAWALVERLVDRWPPQTHAPIRRWMAEVGQILEDVRAGDAATGQIPQDIRDKLALLLVVFPTDEEELCPTKDNRPRWM